MANPDDDFSSAVVGYDAFLTGPDGEPIDVFEIRNERVAYYFRAAFKFADNGSDFSAVISHVGMRDKTWAASTRQDVLKPFSEAAIASIRKRLEDYFQGPEEKTFAPFSTEGANFTGVVFAEGWIRERYTT
jgi:hypothetical protein